MASRCSMALLLLLALLLQVCAQPSATGNSGYDDGSDLADGNSDDATTTDALSHKELKREKAEEQEAAVKKAEREAYEAGQQGLGELKSYVQRLKQELNGSAYAEERAERIESYAEKKYQEKLSDLHGSFRSALDKLQQREEAAEAKAEDALGGASDVESSGPELFAARAPSDDSEGRADGEYGADSESSGAQDEAPETEPRLAKDAKQASKAIVKAQKDKVKAAEQRYKELRQESKSYVKALEKQVRSDSREAYKAARKVEKDGRKAGEKESTYEGGEEKAEEETEKLADAGEHAGEKAEDLVEKLYGKVRKQLKDGTEDVKEKAKEAAKERSGQVQQLKAEAKAAEKKEKRAKKAEKAEEAKAAKEAQETEQAGTGADDADAGEEAPAAASASPTAFLAASQQELSSTGLLLAMCGLFTFLGASVTAWSWNHARRQPAIEIRPALG